MNIYKLNTKDLAENIHKLKVYDKVLLSGTVYTSRDAAHKRIFELLDSKKQLPFELKNAVIYYAGPTKAREGLCIGSCGPTTSSRMDIFTPKLMDLGVVATIGKGKRSDDVINAIKRNSGIYLCAIGGAGALACKCIKSCDVIAFDDLGCESVKKLEFEDFPLIVAIDSEGNNIFDR